MRSTFSASSPASGLQDLYNLMLKKGWTLGSAQLMVGMHAVIRVFHRPAGARCWRLLAQAAGRTWWFRWCPT